MLQSIQETFVENSWDEEATARQKRDERYAQLQASGLDCRKENLYTVDGRRVFVVIATPPEDIAPPPAKTIKSTAPKLKSERSPRPIQPFERR